MNIFEVLFYQPVYNILIIFYHFLGDNLGFAIIAVGLVSRIIMIPITARQLKMAESSREMNSKLKELRKKYKKNKTKLQEETLKLQQEYLPAQLSGCLPTILQLVLFLFIYQVIQNVIQISGETVEGIRGFNDVAYGFVPQFVETYNINSSFLGIVDLKVSATQVGFSSAQVIPYVILAVFVAITNYYSIKLTSALAEKKKEKEVEKKKDEKSKDSPDDFGEIMQQSTKQAMFLMPFLLGFIAYSLPSGLSIYLITTTFFVILQKLISDRLNQKKS